MNSIADSAVIGASNRRAVLAGRQAWDSHPAGTLSVAARVDITLVKALARAFRWRKLLEIGRFTTIDELACAEKINASYVSQVLRLTLLAPDIVEAILDGRQPTGVTLPMMMRGFPGEWQHQTE